MSRILLICAGFVASVTHAEAQSSPTSTAVVTALPRATRAVAYFDRSLERVVMIGGPEQPRANLRDKVWSWSGKRWEVETVAGPLSRGNAGAAYDVKRKVGIVTGGSRRTANDSSFESIAETWEGGRTLWQPIEQTDIPPRDHHSLVFDERRGTVLMFGGMSSGGTSPWPTDTWERQVTGWTRIATTGPAGRARTAMAFDRRREHVVLFGGVGAAPGVGAPQPFFGDTWVFERGAWREVSGSGPRARYAHAMVFDERAGVVLLYGGAAAHRNAPLTDMWQWDGARWTEIAMTGPTPGFRYQPIMVYDRKRSITVLYGGLQGNDDDTWEWNGRSWTRFAP